MTYDEFFKKYNGKAVDYDHTAGVQCVDLADQYLKDVFGITGVWVTGARDFYNKFETYPKLVKDFDKIPNTRELVVQKGDIVVWGGGTWGHVAIGTGSGDINVFDSFEQNTLGKHEPAQVITHKFNGKTGVNGCYPVLGVLRAKDQTKVLGKTAAQKSINDIVDEVIAGRWDSGANRKKKLTAAGYNYDQIQKLVNAKMTKAYTVTAKTGLNIRRNPTYSADGIVVGVYSYGTRFSVTEEKIVNGQAWGKTPKGWCCLVYAKKA